MKTLIVSAIIVGIVIYVGNYKKRKNSVTAGLCVLTIIAAVIASGALSMIPMPVDKIQLTALGEKNPNASYNEVALKNVIVDDVVYEIDNAVEGKWFWQGDVYMWRQENDSRKPEGVTRSVTLEIPKGNNRQLVFSSSEWRGYVEITYNGESEIHDLYNENWVDSNIDVPGSDSFSIFLIKLGRYVIFVLIIAAIMVYFVFAAVKYDYDVIKGWFWRNWDKLVYAVIAVVYIFVLQSVSAEGSLWYDEMWQMGWYYTENWPKDQQTVYSFLFTLWTKYMPYGQEYLRLLSQLFVAGTIYFAGLIGSDFKSKRLGVLLSSSVAFSGSVIYQCSMGIRDYAMMLFTVTLVIYMFIKKQNNKDNPSSVNLLLYGICIALAIDVHIINVMVMGLLMIADFILILLKKTSKKCWLEFIAPAIYGVYWLINVFSNFSIGGYLGWVEKISVRRIGDFIKWVFSYNNVLVLAAVTGFVYIVVKFVSKILKKEFDFNKDFASITILGIPFLQLLIIAVYSFEFCDSGSMFIDRYFVSSFICMFFILASGLDLIIDFLGRLAANKYCASFITSVAVCIMSLYSWTQIEPWNPWSRTDRTTNQDFKSAAEYVIQQNDCYDSSTLFIVDHSDINGVIGIDYYLTYNGKKDKINSCSIWETKNGKKIDSSSIWESKVVQKYSNVYVSYVCGADRANSDLNQILDNEYELVSDDSSARVKKYVRRID